MVDKQIKILFLTIGDESVPSSRVRVFQYLPHLGKEGIKFRVLSFGSRAKSTLSLLALLLFAPFYNIVFIQKALLPRSYLHLLSILNRNLVFDFDDAIYSFDPLFPQNVKDKTITTYRPRLEHTLEKSRLVIVNNSALEGFAKSYCNSIVKIQGPIDTERYLPKNITAPDKEKVVLGWIGSRTTTPYVKNLLPLIEKLARIHSHVEIKLIGATHFEVNDLPIRFIPWSLSTEIRELEEFDIGLMPLPDNEWTRGKGGYKILQYMAMGLPVVASPVGINSSLIREGINGFFANSEEEWLAKLSLLIKDNNLRQRMGNEGRKMAEKAYSFLRSSPLLIDELTKLLSIQ